jgi:hypothetical protein
MTQVTSHVEEQTSSKGYFYKLWIKATTSGEVYQKEADDNSKRALK